MKRILYLVASALISTSCGMLPKIVKEDKKPVPVKETSAETIIMPRYAIIYSILKVYKNFHRKDAETLLNNVMFALNSIQVDRDVKAAEYARDVLKIPEHDFVHFYFASVQQGNLINHRLRST